MKPLHLNRFLTLALVASFSLATACSEGGEDGGSGGSATGGSSSGGGSATGGSSSGGGSNDAQFPSDTSPEGIQAFLAAGSYKSWVGDPSPRSTEVLGSPHGLPLQVYFNETALASPEDQMMGSMSVKELYDDAGTLVGKAANLKTGDNEWTYYCTESPATGRCSGDVETTYPVYGQGIDTACGFCHGEALFAPIPGR